MTAIVDNNNNVLLFNPQLGLIDVLLEKGLDVKLVEIEQKWIIKEGNDDK